MISYAQNHEDVLLERALGDTEPGFYIDVGAHDPMRGSVTRHFYEAGWQGINIEPQPAYAALLREARPRDVTLQIALSDRVGSATLYGWSIGDGVASIDVANVERLTEDYTIVGESVVQVTTLAEVCSAHCEPGRPIGFLKVDVEGHERAVLAGGDWRTWRPRVVVVEATDPLSMHASHEAWEPTLLDAGYVFTLFDGLNRWYAPQEEPHIIQQLRVPVNVLDQYEPYAWVARVAELEAEVISLMTPPPESSMDTVRFRALLKSFESLQHEFHKLGLALRHEYAHGLRESEQMARVREALRLLSRQTPG